MDNVASHPFEYILKLLLGLYFADRHVDGMLQPHHLRFLVFSLDSCGRVAVLVLHPETNLQYNTSSNRYTSTVN